MVRGGKVSGKRSFRKRARSKEGGSDESDEDYVVSDEDRYVSDCLDDSSSSLDGCASEDSFDGFIEEEEGEEDEIQPGRKFYRSRAKNGVCGWQKDASKTSRKRGRVTYAKQEEQEQEADADGEEDEDFDYNDDDDDEEFTPEEEDCSDEELETGVKKKKNNGEKMRKKVLKRRSSVTSTRRRKRRSSRASKKPLRKKRRKNGGLKRKVRCNDVDDFIDNGPAPSPANRKRRRKKLDWEKSSLLDEESNSDRVSSDYEFTISEEEREQVREARELCQSLRRNLRSSSFLTVHEETGVHQDLHQQQKPQGRKGKEKVKEPQGRKGKEKVEDIKSEVVKQVCGICLSEENKRRIRGVLNCCTHYFCFSCIMEWAKVESRCPLCKQRFKTIRKPARASAGIDLREMVVEVPERDQVYQPSEEELRSYIDPYEYVICSECHQGGDDALMLLCDICDSPAHTYCVGLGREVPEGNWYCEGCRPVALGSSSTRVQDRVDDPRVTTQSLPIRPSPVFNVPENIDLNLMFSPLTSQSQGLGHISSSRFSSRSVEVASPVSGGGAPTLSERRWIHRQIQQLRSTDRMASIPARTNAISATSSTSNLYSSHIDRRETNATPHTRTQDVGRPYHPFLDERLCNNNSSSMQTGDPSSMRISNARRPVVQDSVMVSNSPMNGVLWPGLVGTPSMPDNQTAHSVSSRSNITDVSVPPAIRELQQSNFQTVKEQLQSMVKSHLKSLSREIDIGHSTFKEIARSSTHTILAACGLEHKMSEVCTVPSPPVCPHIELMDGGHTSLIRGCCSHCFDSFVRDVVKGIFDTKMSSQQWLRLGL